MRCHVASLKLELGKKLISVLRYGTIGEPYMVTPKVWIHIYVQGLFVPRSSSSERWFLFYRKCKKLGKMSCLYIREVCVFSHVVHTDYASGGIWKRKFYSKKAWNVFRPHYAGEIWKHNTAYLGFAFEKNSIGETTWLLCRYRFRKAAFSKYFLLHQNKKSAF